MMPGSIYHDIWQLAFWLSGGVLFYIYAGYPALIWCLSKVCPRPTRSSPTDLDASVIVAAYNEAARLRAKVQSIRDADLRGQVCEILVASDGSTDGTASVLSGLEDHGVKLLAYAERRGKPAVLNDAVKVTVGDILVFTDARQELAPGAITALLDRFADDEVGVVSGELIFRSQDSDTTAGRGMGAYWHYEKFIRKHEAMVHSVPGATGALYAMRRELYRPLPANALLDDVVAPMQAVMVGKRCCFESKAVVYDAASRTTQQESVRKRRTLAGNVQLLGMYPAWLLPWRNPIWLQFISHKILRLASPFLLLVLLATSVVLCHHWFYRCALYAQLFGYGVAGLGCLVEKSGRMVRWLAVPWMFVSLNIDTWCAVWGALGRRYQVTWERSE